MCSSVSFAMFVTRTFAGYPLSMVRLISSHCVNRWNCIPNVVPCGILHGVLVIFVAFACITSGVLRTMSE